MTWRRLLPSLKQMSSEVAELNMDLGAQSAQQQKMDAMRFDEQKICATTNLRQVTADVLVVMQRQVPVIQRVQRAVDVPLVQYIDAVVGVPVVKQRQALSIQTVHVLVEISYALVLQAQKIAAVHRQGG